GSFTSDIENTWANGAIKYCCRCRLSWCLSECAISYGFGLFRHSHLRCAHMVSSVCENCGPSFIGFYYRRTIWTRLSDLNIRSLHETMKIQPQINAEVR